MDDGNLLQILTSWINEPPSLPDSNLKQTVQFEPVVKYLTTLENAAVCYFRSCAMMREESRMIPTHFEEKNNVFPNLQHWMSFARAAKPHRIITIPLCRQGHVP